MKQNLATIFTSMPMMEPHNYAKAFTVSVTTINEAHRRIFRLRPQLHLLNT